MRIVEWNVGLKKEYSAVCRCLSKLDPVPAIIVLTEVKGNQVAYQNELKQYKVYAKDINGGTQYANVNDILIGTRTNLIFDEEEIGIEPNSRQYPDWRKIQFSYGSRKLILLCVRFKNYKMSNQDKKTQIQEFYRQIEGEGKPDIIIGDFNIGSALDIKGVSWSQFKRKMFEREYRYQDATSGEWSFSFQRVMDLRQKYIGSAPDNLFVRNGISEHRGITVKDASYSWGYDDENWPADHGMLIVDFEVT